MQGGLADKAATSFTSAINRHGVHESTLLALNNTLYHWGAIIVPIGKGMVRRHIGARTRSSRVPA